MDSNITFRIDADVKQKMSAICKELGMSTSTAFNLFANAFVRVNGMPFPVTIQAPERFETVSTEQMTEDAAQILTEFADDYRRLAE